MKHLEINEPGLESLKFFGRVNASISHELKNILAIISETTGFLDDLTALARQGKKFDLSILENSNKSIEEEIERGFHTIRQMNKFAHCVDDMEADILISDSLNLAVNLTGFLSSVKPVRLITPEKEPLVTTVPFLLLNFLYQLLIDLYQNSDAAELTVRVEPAENGGVNLLFSGFDSFDTEPLSPAVENIKNNMAIQSKISQDPLELEISIPSVINLNIG